MSLSVALAEIVPGYFLHASNRVFPFPLDPPLSSPGQKVIDALIGSEVVRGLWD